MDNKKWSKRFSTIFWWLFTILPLIVALIWFISAHLTFNSGMSSPQNYIDLQIDSNITFGQCLYEVLIDDISGMGFNMMILPFISSLFNDLFDLLGNGSISLDLIPVLFSWMVSVTLYHLMFDIIVWLPCFLHDLIDRFRK